MKTKKKALTRAAAVILTAAIIALVLVGILGLFAHKYINTRADEELFLKSRSVNSTVFYANGGDGGVYEPIEMELAGSMRKVFYPINENSRYLIDGFIAVEDRSFYQHKGIDVKRLAAAAKNYIFRTERIFGASTITQQVIKNISGDNERSLTRKLAEIIRALRIERRYSKDDIMEVYLNIVPMSDNIYGVGTAARAYFGKNPDELTAAEAATLIGITNAPTAYNPYTNPESCLKKRNTVLSVMRSEGVITDEEYKVAVAEELEVIPREEREDRYDSWFVETVIEDATADIAAAYNISEQAARIMLLGGGYKVYTTANMAVQRALEEYFENTDNFSAEINNGLNYAMAVSDSLTGNLLGIVGRVGKKQANRLLNHATAPHTPGSVMKPLGLYAPLIDEGKINWATVLDDVPVSFTEAGRAYPRNSPDVYDGLTTVYDAVRLSKNTVAVRLCNMRTPARVFDTLSGDFGIDTLVKNEKGTSGQMLTDLAVSPMALGQLTYGASLRKLTECYTVFPSEGVLHKGRSYLSIVDSEGEVVIENVERDERLFKPETARIMNQMLKGVVDEGTAGGLSLKETVDLAGKTGTSGSNKDKMFIGYTPYFTAGIWCGYESGGSVAAVYPNHLTIWNDIMSKIHEEADISEERSFSTEGLVRASYCMDSGERYSENCLYDVRGSREAWGYFTPDNQPSGTCSRHVLCSYDSVGKGVAGFECPEENIVTVSLLNIPERSFPREIYVTDSEFVYRDISGYAERPKDENLPYFYYALPEGEYVGRGRGGRQFNCACPKH